MTRPLGYDVDDNAIRFSNYFHVLRELVHFTNGWMPVSYTHLTLPTIYSV